MPAEWEHQSCVQLTWPHKDTDWADMLPEITAVYEEMATSHLSPLTSYLWIPTTLGLVTTGSSR